MAKLHFYYSAMNAGKSTTLLQSNYNYQERGMRTILFTAEIDTRFGKDKIASRIGLVSDAIGFNSELNLYHATEKLINQHDKIKCVLIDEAQFLTKDQVWQLTRVVDELHIPVLAYGLRSDFLGETFEGSKYLLAWAEELTEIKTICFCGRKATMNLRIDENGNPVRSGEQIEIGDNDRYLAVCRQHFKEGKIKE